MASSDKLSAATLPPDFLHSKPDNITIDRIDFEKTSIPSYQGFYAVVLDNVLSPSECRALVQAAEARTNGVWEQAMVNVGGGLQALSLETRKCGRVIWDDDEVAMRILKRIRGHLPELEVLEIAGRKMWPGGARFRLTRPNERMRFLRYEPGNYFKRSSEPSPPPSSTRN
jgi:hypothetical protein